MSPRKASPSVPDGFYHAGGGGRGALVAAAWGAVTTLVVAMSSAHGGGASASVAVPSVSAILVSSLTPIAVGLCAAACFGGSGGAGDSRLADALWLPRTLRAAFRHALAGCAAGAFLALPLMWITGATRAVLSPLGIPDSVQPALRWLLSDTTPFATKCALGFSAIALAPLSEEILYRALLWRGLAAIWPRRAAVVVAAVFFAALHLQLAIMPALVVLSLALSFAFRRMSLVGAVAMHASFNAANFALALLMSGD